MMFIQVYVITEKEFGEHEDHDLWMRDKGHHWKYIVTYVDNLLVFNKRPMEILDNIRETYDLKGFGAPEYYLRIDYISSQNLKD